MRVSVSANSGAPRTSKFYTPFARQQEFHDSPAKYRLFGGAAGPGKTKALLWEAIFQANRVPQSDSLLLRRTFSELEMSLLAEFRKNVPRDLYEKYNDAKRVITWWNGSTTRFGYCRNEKDVYQYQGAEFLFIGLDELTHFTLKQWQFLTSRNRCSVPGSFPCMAGASNPGNIGHAWVKALWVDKKAPAGFERPELYDPAEYEFTRARLDDNPIYANDASYRRTLEILPSHLRRAFLDGDWGIFAGQYFDIFDLGKHTQDGREVYEGIQPWWPHWISIDWGFHHPSAVYWHAKAPDGPPFHGRVFTYREFCTEPERGLSPRALGQRIAEQTKERITEIFLSPDAFAHRTAEASIAEQLAEVFESHDLPRPEPADDDRIGGWQWMYQLMEGEAWVISELCPKLIACLPTLVRDEPPHAEDVMKVDGDDPADAARYGLVHLKRQLVNTPKEERFRQRQQASSSMEKVVDEETGKEKFVIRDMTSFAINQQKLEAEDRKKFVPKRRPRPWGR
ncbi:MAG TPA: hypothetical protein VKQ28_00740 [Candidatus Acidoferrum sp.]|nr:hypothetical protein [Candidatus Acidoferrum sp.]